MTEHPLNGWAEEARNVHAARLAACALDRVEEIEQDAMEAHILPLQGLAIMLCQRVTIGARQACEDLIAEYLAYPPVGDAEAEAELADRYTTGIGITLLKAAAGLKDLTDTLFAFDQAFGLHHTLPILKALYGRCPAGASEEDKAALVQALLAAKSDQGISRIARALRGEDLEDR